jgi:D-3-phosphoglycerate dehydrogenase
VKVLITSNSFGKYSDDAEKLLADNNFEIIKNKYHRMMNEGEFIEEIKDVDGVILSTESLNKNVIDHAKKLKIVSRYGVGIDNIDTEYLKEKGIELRTAKNCNNVAVAEYAVGLIINIVRKISAANRSVRNNKWSKEVGIDVNNSTVGIIGLGSIGREVAKRLSNFGCKLISYDLFYDDEFCNRYKIHKVSLDTLLKESHIITLHLPSLNSDKPLLSKREFELMKEGVVIINTARADLIDTEEVLANLEKGKIFGYAFDVHKDEPNIDLRFAKYDNVVMTPHNAAVSKGAVDKMSYVSAKNIIDFFNGK